MIVKSSLLLMWTRAKKKSVFLFIVFFPVCGAHAGVHDVVTWVNQYGESPALHLVLPGLVAVAIAGLFGSVMWGHSNGSESKIPNDSNKEMSQEEEIQRLKKIQLLLHKKWQQEREQRTKLSNAYKKLHAIHKNQEHLKGNLKEEQEMRSDIQSAYQKLQETQAKLIQAEKMSSLGKLTAGIAHEINNPVNFVANGVHSLRENFDQLNSFIENYKKISQLDSIEEVRKYSAILDEDEEDLIDLRDSTKELLDDADYGTQRITEIVRGLRSFSRQDESEFTEVQINDVLEGALAILKPKYKKKATIVKNLDSSMPAIRCFSGQINQVIVNLLGNAADAIDESGKITLTTKDIDQNRVEITISDTGKGMSQEILDKIFDPFFTTKEVGKGTGLGLSITYGIINRHQGTITVQSTVGEGTKFTIILPKVIEMITENTEGSTNNLGF